MRVLVLIFGYTIKRKKRIVCQCYLIMIRCLESLWKDRIQKPQRVAVNVNLQLVQWGEIRMKILIFFFSPPHINELTQRNSSRTYEPSAIVYESTDWSHQWMFALGIVIFWNKPKGLVTWMIRHVKNISAIFYNTLNNIPHFCLNADVLSNDVYVLTEMLKLDDISYLI